METAFLFSSALLLLGLVLRANVRLLQRLYVPAAILGGLVGLALLRAGIAAEQWQPQVAALAATTSEHLNSWPGWLIAVVFAGLLLDKRPKSWRAMLLGAPRQGNMVWIICLGQVGLGALAVWLMVEPLQLETAAGKPPIYFAQLIEAGFVGGHGTSSALGVVYEEMGYGESPREMAFFMATVGLIYSVVSGVFFVNLAVRWGWTRAGDVQIPTLSGMEQRHQPVALGHAKVNSEVLDPLVFQVLILAGAFAAGLALQQLVSLPFEEKLPLPLFMFTLIGGWFVREILRVCGMADLVDAETIRRLVAAAMEYLIVAAIASLNIELVIQAIVPLSILLAVGFVWTAICLLYIGRQLLPSAYWFELGIINYGMSTGVTASGLMLLRIIDKDFESGAAEDYALAAPLSSPFVGGGIITVAVFPYMLQQLGIGITATIVLAVVAVLYGLGLVLARRA